MNVSSKTRGMDAGDGGGVRCTAGDVASLLLGSKWAMALLTALAGNLALSLSAGYPLVLPGGAVASSPSILSLIVSVVLCLASGMLAPALARRVPVPLAMATCACLPVTAVLSPVTWGVPAFAVVPTVALACGALCWVLRRLWREGGVPVPSCVAALVGTALLVALLHAGGPMCARHPRLLATGYARAGEVGGHGIHGGLASSLCVSWRGPPRGPPFRRRIPARAARAPPTSRTAAPAKRLPRPTVALCLVRGCHVPRPKDLPPT